MCWIRRIVSAFSARVSYRIYMSVKRLDHWLPEPAIRTHHRRGSSGDPAAGCGARRSGSSSDDTQLTRQADPLAHTGDELRAVLRRAVSLVPLHGPRGGRGTADLRIVRTHLDAGSRLPGARGSGGLPGMDRKRHGARPCSRTGSSVVSVTRLELVSEARVQPVDAPRPSAACGSCGRWSGPSRASWPRKRSRPRCSSRRTAGPARRASLSRPASSETESMSVRLPRLSRSANRPASNCSLRISIFGAPGTEHGNAWGHEPAASPWISRRYRAERVRTRQRSSPNSDLGPGERGRETMNLPTVPQHHGRGGRAQARQRARPRRRRRDPPRGKH